MFPPYGQMLLIDCSHCRTRLQLPPGASSIRCAVCRAVTRVADSRSSPAIPSAPPFPPPPGPGPASIYPPPPSWGTPSAPPIPGGRKKAVICGITYRNTRHELKGCINDAKCMKYLLINRFGFQESNIIMLTGRS